jgi:hypothetical protein
MIVRVVFSWSRQLIAELRWSTLADISHVGYRYQGQNLVLKFGQN